MAALLIPLLRCAPLTINQTCAEIVLEDPLQKPDELGGLWGSFGSVIKDRFWGGELRTPTREHRVASRGSGDATAAEVRLFGIVFDLTTTRVWCRRGKRIARNDVLVGVATSRAREPRAQLGTCRAPTIRGIAHAVSTPSTRIGACKEVAMGYAEARLGTGKPRVWI